MDVRLRQTESQSISAAVAVTCVAHSYLKTTYSVWQSPIILRITGKQMGNHKCGNQDCSVYRFHEELLECDDLDAVIIATGDRWHSVLSNLGTRGKGCLRRETVLPQNRRREGCCEGNEDAQNRMVVRYSAPVEQFLPLRCQDHS